MSRMIAWAGALSAFVVLVACGQPPSANDERPVETAIATQPLVVLQGREVESVVVDGYVIVEGDIIVGRASEGSSRGPKLVIQSAGARWPNATIPFEFDAALSEAQRQAIQQAMNDWSAAVPALRFVTRNTEPDFVRFTLASSCSSFVGRQGGAQVINLTNGCINTFSTHHEIAHALGFFHEHTRKDRDAFVTVNWADILGCPADAEEAADCGCEAGQCGCPADRACNFSGNFLTNTARSDVLDYDYGSMMHYSPFGFSWTGNETLTTLQPLNGAIVGQRFQLSSGDIAKMNVAYPEFYVPNFVFSEVGEEELCELVGREDDVGTDFVVTGWPTTVTDNRADTDSVAPGTYAVTCTARSVFFAENYDYPNTTVRPNINGYPAGDIETYSMNVSVTSMPVGIVAAIF